MRRPGDCISALPVPGRGDRGDLCDGQREDEPRTPQLAGIDGDPAAVGIDDPAADREPDAEPASLRLSLAAHVGREEALAVVLRNPATVVFHRDGDETVALRGGLDRRRDADDPFRPAIAERIGQEIGDHLLDPTRVEPEARERRREAELDLHLTLVEERGERFELRAERLVQVRFDDLDRERGSAGAARFHQISDEAIEAAACLQALVDEMALVFVQGAACIALEQAAETGDDRDRRAELVAHEVDQLGADAGLAGELRLELGDALLG